MNRLFLVVFIFFLTEAVFGFDIPCPAIELQVELAPESMYGIEIIKNNNSGVDISISALPQYRGLPLEQILVQQTLNGRIVFATALAMHTLDKRAVSRLFHIPESQVNSYGFILDYSKSEGRCIVSKRRFQTEPLSKGDR